MSIFACNKHINIDTQSGKRRFEFLLKKYVCKEIKYLVEIQMCISLKISGIFRKACNCYETKYCKYKII